uniref:RGS domain-containing protein n=1 Tax=Hippocampus comes TaxID=109280 RepID=A0A3Q2YC76_HIPCM
KKIIFLPADTPQLTVDNFENFLTSDHLFVHLLNKFLSLPCFPQALLYNQETDQFEVPSNAAEFTFNKIKLALEHSKSQPLSKDVKALAKTPLVDNRYTVSCLDLEQGVQWIIKERLTFFLQSSFYHEYRYSMSVNHPEFLPTVPSRLPLPPCPPSSSKDKKCKCIACQCPLDENIKEPCEECQKWSRGIEIIDDDDDERKMSEGSSDFETPPGVCCQGTCHLGNQPGMDDFKKFLCGTSGGKLFNFWMDIERLKTVTGERENSFLALMRSRYLLSSSQNSLHLQLLCRLGLTTSPCWSKARLCSIQPNIMENVNLNVTTSHFYEQPRPSRSQSLGRTRLDNVLQALFADPDAGSYFAHFCEQSGNQVEFIIWVDTPKSVFLFVTFQLLYATYLHSSASRSVGMKEEIKEEVYNQLMPAFEELFDNVEDGILNILMEAWTALVDRDKKSFRQVQQCMTSPSNTSPRLFCQAFDSWSNVPPQYRGYGLGSLLRHHHAIWHFMSFLRNKDASIHLECWMDLEQYRRTPQKNTALRQGRSSRITKKYLNRNYFFSSHSPATEEQQNNILHLAGGLGLLKLECLSEPVTVEIQDIIRCHIEKKWLPQFLVSAEFLERRRRKPKVQQHTAILLKGQIPYFSSKEILLFRRLLLDPASCLHFQHFVSPKGDFLENDVLFWLEVQRYKDLCHSHSDEATVQQKISTIIKCFINSSTPPALQIDIPLEQAQHIMQNRHELGPYVFREAQVMGQPVTSQFVGSFIPCVLCLSWSYSKYMTALKRDKALPKRQSQKEASLSTYSAGTLPAHSISSLLLDRHKGEP